MINFIM